MDTTFQDSHSRSAGGALYIDGFPTHFTITDSTFTGNSTEVNDGGAINLRSWLTLDISGSTFSDNVAGYDGGALFVDTSPLLGPVATATISDTTFENNEATDGGGGAILALSYAGDTMDLCLDTVVFDGNHCDNKGGALDLGYLGGYNVTLLDTDFLYNSAEFRAGALILDADLASSFVMDGGSMVGNQAVDFGAAATFVPDDEVYDVSLTSVLVDSNVLTGDPTGAFWAYAGTSVVADSCTFTNNDGGGFYLDESETASLDSIDTNWGTGADDNSPWDVAIQEGVTYTTFGANETFSCVGATGCQ